MIAVGAAEIDRQLLITVGEVAFFDTTFRNPVQPGMRWTFPLEKPHFLFYRVKTRLCLRRHYADVPLWFVCRSGKVGFCAARYSWSGIPLRGTDRRDFFFRNMWIIFFAIIYVISKNSCKNVQMLYSKRLLHTYHFFRKGSRSISC